METENSDSTRASTRLDIAITIGLGLAAVLTALCVYLIDVHDDEALLAFNSGVSKNTQSTGSFVEAAQQRSADDALFTQYAVQANAGATDKTAFNAASFILTEIMSDALRKQIKWWANQPEGGPTTPFVSENPFFEEPARDEAEALAAAATEEFETAEEEQRVGDTYIIAQIIVAIALFLFGIAGVSRASRSRFATTVLAYIVFLASLVIVVAG